MRRAPQKVCPECGVKVHVRKKKCICGHEFIPKNAQSKIRTEELDTALKNDVTLDKIDTVKEVKNCKMCGKCKLSETESLAEKQSNMESEPEDLIESETTPTLTMPEPQ